MAVTSDVMTEPAVAEVTSVQAWSLPERILFRFGVLYFSIYILTTQMLPGLIQLPVGGIPTVTYLPPARALFSWVATHVFRVTAPFVDTVTGSGDRTLDWMQAFCVLVLAVAGTLVWSALTSRREHRKAQKWIWIFLRFSLAATMFGYGFAKAVPLQMPAPFLTRLLEPYGNFSPMGVLWASIGASFSYEIFVGCAEIAGGLLLCIPQLWVLGALVTLADVSEVFALNMTYDVPVKLFSFHLILMALFLLAPEARRLLDVLVFNRAVGPSTFPVAGKTQGRRRLIVAAQLAFGAYLIGINAFGSYRGWHLYGGGAPKSPLYGIWTVDRMSIDGVERAPLLTDYDRWRHIVFYLPTMAAFQRMDSSFTYFPANVDTAKRTVTLTTGPKGAKAELTYQRPDPESMTIEGTMLGHATSMRLRRVDETKMMLLSRGFHWIQERPFNR